MPFLTACHDNVKYTFLSDSDILLLAKTPGNESLFTFMTYKSLNEKGPVYLRELFQLRDPPRTLRSVHALILDYPRTKLASYGDRAFSIAAAVKWNRLPQKIRASVSVNAFKCQLKSYLFRKRYTCV